MAETITWRNVTGQSLADAAKPFEYASRSFNDAISGLRGVVTDQQEANQRVIDNRRFEERLGYQEALRSANTPEELLARRAQLEAQFAGMDPKNRAQLMSAMNDRELALRESAIAANQYADQTEERASRDAIAQIRAGILRGEDMSGQIGALGSRFQADLLKEADARSQTQVDRDRATKEFGWKGEAHENSLLNSAAQRALYGAQASAAGAQVKLAQQARQDNLDQIKVAQTLEAMNKNKNLYGDTATPEINLVQLDAEIDERVKNETLSSGEGEALKTRLRNNLFVPGATLPNGQNMPTPLYVLRNAISAAESGTFTRTGANFDTYIEKQRNAHKGRWADEYVEQQMTEAAYKNLLAGMLRSK